MINFLNLIRKEKRLLVASYREGHEMPVEILMPALSPTMTEGKLFKWLKEEGDTIEPGDAVAEIETDKATMEVEAVDSGVLQKILVAEETEGVPVNTPIALLAVDGEDNGALSDNQVEPGAQAPAKEIVEPVQNELNSKNSQRKPSAARYIYSNGEGGLA